MTWLPERPGRWLFHCHMLVHMSPPEWQMLVGKPEQGAVTTAAQEHSYPAETQHLGMGGLVLGITVLGGGENAKPATWHAERKLQLTLDERSGGIRLTYALQLRDLAVQPPLPEPATSQLIGPPIVLTRGQPVEIELVNRSRKRRAIRGHGIELESYYDGVAGWTGTAEQTTPPIQPGGFVPCPDGAAAGRHIYLPHTLARPGSTGKRYLWSAHRAADRSEIRVQVRQDFSGQRGNFRTLRIRSAGKRSSPARAFAVGYVDKRTGPANQHLSQQHAP